MVFFIISVSLGTTNVAAINNSLEKDPIPINRENWLYVGGSGPGNYSTIQSAINAADTNDVIFVFQGTYYENLLIDKSISILGEKKETTIINGRNTVDVIKILRDNVFLNNFILLTV